MFVCIALGYNKIMFIGTFWFIFGVVIGSFLNVLVIRLGTGESVVSGGSRCLSCKRRLHWPELIPLVSFFIFRGHCGHCGSRISWQYPAVEFATGLVFLFIWLRIQQNFQFSIFNFQTIISFLFVAAMASLLIAISIYDIRHQIIPNQLAYPFIVLALFSVVWRLKNWSAFGGGKLAGENLAVGIGLFAFFALLWFVSRGRWMGFGDAKLALGIGWWLGWPLGITAFLFSFWTGAVVGVFLLIFSVPRRLKGKYSLASRLPFGPFLAAGALAAFFVGERAVDWYFRLFF
ncbi:MAG: prepilin peptidase [Parcubacteria group bacterium]|nr:prepilin peptidase [Parcubacteria group bacterium]